MTVETVFVETSDGLSLGGSLFEPEPGKACGIGIVLVHGLKWSFDTGPSKWLAPLLAEHGYTVLSLSLRDHGSDDPRDLDLAHRDLRAGVDYLSARVSEVAFLAHGYGGAKAICYTAHSGDTRVRRLILVTLGALYSYRRELWESVLASASAIEGKIVVVQGAADPNIEPSKRGQELSDASRGSETSVVLIEGANHYFEGKQEALVKCVDEWFAANPVEPRLRA